MPPPEDIPVGMPESQNQAVVVATEAAVVEPPTETAGSHWKEALSHHLDVRKSRKMMIVCVSTILYFVLAIAVYLPAEEEWTAGDCLYYAVVVVTTVGYGDYLPSSEGMKIFTIFYIHFGLCIVVLAITIVQDIIVHVAQKRLHAKSVGLFDEKGQQRQNRNNVIITLSLYVSCLLFGTLFFGLLTFKDKQDETGSDAHWFVDGLYLTVVTLSTVGFGDYSPQTDATKFVACIFMLVGIPICASTFSMVNAHLYSGNDHLVLQKIKGGLTKEKFDDMDQFVKDLRKEGVGNYRDQGDDNISRFEFLAFMLIRQGVIEKRNIVKMMDNFDKIDRQGDGSGFINRSSIQRSVSQSNVNTTGV